DDPHPARDAREVGEIDGPQARRRRGHHRFEEAFDLGVDDRHQQVAPGDDRALLGAHAVVAEDTFLVADEDLLARRLLVDVLDRRGAFPLGEAGLEPEDVHRPSHEARLGVRAHGADDADDVIGREQPPRVRREVERDPAGPVVAAVDVAVDAAVADRRHPHASWASYSAGSTTASITSGRSTPLDSRTAASSASIVSTRRARAPSAADTAAKSTAP